MSFRRSNASFTQPEPSTQSGNLRKAANDEMEKQNFQTSLVLFNQALLACGKGLSGRADAALCYGNRATVYKLNSYNNCCLQSIELAEPHYPREKIQKMLDMRKLCLNPEDGKKDAEKSVFPNTFDQLPRPASFSLPFFVDGIELIENETFGRHLIAKQDFQAGEIVAVISRENHNCSSNIIEQANLAWACYHCLNVNNLNLMKNEECCQGEQDERLRKLH